MIHGGASHSDSIGQQCTTIATAAGSKFYRLMVDCGMEFQREEEIGGVGPAPDFSLLNGQKVDGVFLTHYHFDHAGAVAVLRRRQLLAEDALVNGSPQTLAILPWVLQDGLKNNPQFNAFDAANILKRRRIIETPGEFEILPGLKVYVPQMGHAPGNGGIVIPLASGRKGFITSDFCRHDQPITKGVRLPSEFWPREWLPDEIWGTDLTYGETGQRKSPDDEVARLIDRTKLVISRGQKEVVAGFGNGRIQNLAYWFSKAGIPVYIDGIARNIYLILQETRWNDRDGLLPKIGEKSGIRVVKSAEHREELIESSEPCVILTTGGMGDFGPIVRYMKAGLPSTDYVFIFTSWLAPGSNGRKLVQKAKEREAKGTKKSITLRDKDEKETIVSVRAEIDHFSLSAHGTLDEFAGFIEDIVRCRDGRILERIVLTHGTSESKSRAAICLRPFAKEIVWGERNTVISLS